jgi:thiosulfate dehydrogenase [quinone] large subunit
MEENVRSTARSHWRGAALAFLLLRLTLGLNICMHGVSRIAAGPSIFANSLVPMFRNTPLPAWSVHGFGLVLPWAEAIPGFLLLLGFCTRFALIAGSLLIVILTFGTAFAAGLEHCRRSADLCSRVCCAAGSRSLESLIP